MSNPWFRMYSEFAFDPKIQMLPEFMQRRFIMLLCARCNGNVTLQDEEVTFLLRISETEWQETKALFITRNFIDSSNNILNWDKRQFRSDSSKERVARHRNKQKQDCNVTVTPPEQNRTEQIQNRKRVRATPSTALTKMPFIELPFDWKAWTITEKGWDESVIADVWSVFREHWVNGKGRNTRREEWSATWHNWCRKEKFYTENNRGNYAKPTKLDLISQGIADARAARKRAEQG